MAGAFEPARHRAGICLESRVTMKAQATSPADRRTAAAVDLPPGIRPERRRFAHRTFLHRLEDLPPVRGQGRAARNRTRSPAIHGEAEAEAGVRQDPSSARRKPRSAAVPPDGGRAVVEGGRRSRTAASRRRVFEGRWRLAPAPGSISSDRHDRRRGGAAAEAG